MRKFILFIAILAFLLLSFTLIVAIGNGSKDDSGSGEVATDASATPGIVDPSPTPDESSSPDAPTEQEKEITEMMEETFAGGGGTCHWGVYTFAENGYCRNETKPVPSASVIKLFIMDYAFEQMEAGTLEYTDTIEGVTVKSLLERMITVSDNEATNAFIDRFGMDKLNAYFESAGYADTRVGRRMLDYDAMAAGRDNYTSVWDVVQFLKKVYYNQSDWTCADMLAIMERQQVKTKIPRLLPGGVRVAHKTGELDTVENDVGIIFTEDADFAVVFLCSDLSDRASARDMISNASKKLYTYFTSNE